MLQFTFAMVKCEGKMISTFKMGIQCSPNAFNQRIDFLCGLSSQTYGLSSDLAGLNTSKLKAESADGKYRLSYTEPLLGGSIFMSAIYLYQLSFKIIASENCIKIRGLIRLKNKTILFVLGIILIISLTFILAPNTPTMFLKFMGLIFAARLGIDYFAFRKRMKELLLDISKG